MAGLRMKLVYCAVILLSVAALLAAGDTCDGYYDSDWNWQASFECNGLLDGGDTCCGTLTNKYCCYSTAGTNYGETCSGYVDSNGDWQDSFDCNGILGIYCCGTLDNKYCCNDESDRLLTEAVLSAAIIAVIVIAVIVAVIIGIVVCICICCCECCRTRTTTTRYVHTTGVAGTTVMTSSTNVTVPPSSIQTSQGGYAPTAAVNPMQNVAQYPPQPPPAYGQAAPEYYPK